MPAAPKLTLGMNVDGHTYIGGDPNSKGSWINVDEVASSGLSGKDFLDTLSKSHPSAIPTIKALSEGRQALPTGRATTDPYWQTMLTLAHQYDPSLDQADYGKRYSTAKNFASGGSEAANIRNLNQGIGHLNGLADAIPKVAGHAGLLGLSHLINVGENQFADWNGDPGITDFNIARTALAGELASIFKGKGSSAEQEVNKWYAQLTPSASTAQKQAAIRGITQLLNSRLDELGEQYTQGMGTIKQGYDFLNPVAKKAFTRLQTLGVDPATASAITSSSTPPVDDATSALLKKYNVPGY